MVLSLSVTAVAEDWLGKWAMNQMLINVSTRKFARSVRLPEGDVPAPMGSGLWCEPRQRHEAAGSGRFQFWSLKSRGYDRSQGPTT